MGAEGDGSKVKLVGFAAGVCSGLTKLAIGHPFDTIKTRMQCAPLRTYRGAADCLARTIRHEGPRALYKGASPPAVGWMITDSVLLGSLHNYRLWLSKLDAFREVDGSGGTRLSVLGHSVAGGMAGWSNAVFAHPIETLKGKLQLQLSSASESREFSGPIDCARSIVRTQGLGGLWKGLPATLAFRSNFAWMFGGYEVVLRSFARLDGTDYALALPTQTFLAGGIAANAFWLGALPADVVKNRLMTDSLSAPRYPTVMSAVQAVHRETGLRGFYRGFVPVILRAFPTNASALFVYEGILRLSGADTTRS